jgi:hypothetical protein
MGSPASGRRRRASGVERRLLGALLLVAAGASPAGCGTVNTGAADAGDASPAPDLDAATFSDVTQPPGTACAVSDGCGPGEYCGPSRSCTAAGTGVAGAPCASDAACTSGLRCNLVGFAAECQAEGSGRIGGACATSVDCLAGLGCTTSGGGDAAAAPSCQSLPASDGALALGVPAWTGATCVDVPGPTQAYFRVPRGTGDGDFYRLPFPNDVRSTGGKLDLSGHPTPGASLLGYDLVQRYLDDLTATADGFSAYPTVLFRFSAAIDQTGTLKGANAIQLLDVTQPMAPVPLGFTWSSSSARNAYLCDNWVGVRPALGQPLTPGHTYAVLLASSVLDATLEPIAPPSDLTALLAPTSPSDPALAAQWPKYQVLRDWAKAAGVATASILDATVFTVGHPNAIGPKLAAAVTAAAAPVATGWIRCGDAPSPCPQATGDRACGAVDPAFDELHALVTLPIFQQGTEPYSTPADGGDFARMPDGTPIVQRTESVCMALTVPKAAPMPAGGWPLLVYAHGTGGSFRSAITEGVAAREASIADGKGGFAHVAVLGIDQVEHGTRRGASTASPDDLFYNFANPRAARGNPLQGAADQMALVRFASVLDLAAATSPTHAEIKAGPIAFWGHSQGATAGAIAMPYVSGVLGAVLSGEGASLIDALLGKKNPVDIADALPTALEDVSVDEYHPVLALLQNDLDPADPLNHAAALVVQPLTVATTKNVFQPFGVGDTYAPPATERTFAAAAQLAEIAPPAGMTAPPLASTPLPAPSGQNATKLGVIRTAAVRQYVAGATYDGHFVAYDNASATADVDHFIADCLAGQAPNVGR